MAKKVSLWILFGLMAFSTLSLLLLQWHYVDELHQNSQHQFDEAVNRSLYRVVRFHEREEMRRFISDNFMGSTDTLHNLVRVFSEMSYDANAPVVNVPTSQLERSSLLKLGGEERSLSKLQQAQCERYEKYMRQAREAAGHVIAHMLDQVRSEPINARVDCQRIDVLLQNEFELNHIALPYVFSITNDRNVELCTNNSDLPRRGTCYRQQLFPSDPVGRVIFLNLWIPDAKYYNFAHLSRISIPILVSIVFVLLTFAFILAYVLRQRNLSEMKSDFVNNMTHELKTPISSISLAGQMLNDPKMAANPRIQSHVARVVTDETKRLSFLVERVLQMSAFENGRVKMDFQEIDVNELLNTIVENFSLKVKNLGGKILPKLQADNPFVVADELHLTNVLYNLMDNAVKYRRDTLILTVTTSNNDKGNLVITIEDNGIGIAREHLRSIFDKFYRVPTGNVHNIKGFGIGLAYVAKAVAMQHGTVRAESELGIGSKFIIELPAVED